MTLERPSPAVPLACCLWLADYREKNSLGALSHTAAEAEGLATKPHCQNVLVLYHIYLPWNLCYARADFCHVFCSYMTPSFLSYSLLSQYNFYVLLFYNSPFFAPPTSFSFFSFHSYFFSFNKLLPSLSSFARSYISHHSPFHSWPIQTFLIFLHHVQRHSLHNSDSISTLPLVTGIFPSLIYVRISYRAITIFRGNMLIIHTHYPILSLLTYLIF